LTKHTTTLKEFANFQLGQYQRSQTGHELIRRHERSEWMLLRALAIWQELLKQGMTGLHLQKITENFSAIKIKEIDADGKESYVIKEYSPELLKN
jgi:hypothetical protein